MPTPSSNAPPAPQSPRFFPFSSCPDPDEQQQAIQLSATQSTDHNQIEEPPSPPLPSSWHPRPPPPYSADVGTQARLSSSSMDDDAAMSRSVTMSPGPQSSDLSSRDIDMEEQELDESSTGTAGRDDGMTEDEGPKQTETDEDLSFAINEYGRPVDFYDQTAALARSGNSCHALGGGGKRKQQRVSFLLPAGGEVVDEAELWDRMGKNAPEWVEDSGLVGMGYGYSQMRVIPTAPSSCLRAGSRFEGSQQSERQRYDVQVEIKHVDLRESFLCGYLRIQGLTDDHPTLTTYFEGEIIGTKYGFITQHPGWGATDKIDLNHWAKFAPFKPYAKQAKKGCQVLIKDVAQRENIFMRWKEHFLVPDHRVRTINGASFEGFYYICFNQVRKEVSGIYFHSKSEKFQQLELKHVEDKGCFGTMEFR
ncbi:vacuolar import and degradation protein-domain-containing protein [Podospora didyma]|uniref:Vacuolar import and degradation protein-domain-containing protein n=1 Tax=Podospora didyma TaxID=330526 RepID=A0AAE0U542_9PEZI|nr:vacuolar import and degradation protein-domain-containing protein [Podospora didyma]